MSIGLSQCVPMFSGFFCPGPGRSSSASMSFHLSFCRPTFLTLLLVSSQVRVHLLSVLLSDQAHFHFGLATLDTMSSIPIIPSVSNLSEKRLGYYKTDHRDKLVTPESYLGGKRVFFHRWTILRLGSNIGACWRLKPAETGVPGNKSHLISEGGGTRQTPPGTNWHGRFALGPRPQTPMSPESVDSGGFGVSDADSEFEFVDGTELVSTRLNEQQKPTFRPKQTVAVARAVFYHGHKINLRLIIFRVIIS